MDKIIRTCFSRFYVWWVGLKSGVTISKSVFLKGMPAIFIRDGGEIIIGESVTLNSKNRKYHVNMHSPVKLIAEGSSAKIIIGSNTRIHGSCINARGQVTIGKNCLIAANCQIIDNDGHSGLIANPEERSASRGPVANITIEDNVWIGMNCIILPGTSIGQGAVCGAGSVVMGAVPARSLYVSHQPQIKKVLREDD
jgi:acetyltransferase-like isoleucine patch superfamily enzyme